MTAPLPIPSWLRIKQHAQEQIETLRDALERAGPDRIAAIQAEIRVWRQVIDLPATLSDESIMPPASGYT